MVGIQTLNDLYKEQGESFIKKLLNNHITITEKLAGNLFSFVYKNEKFIFYKRNVDNPITKIDRAIMIYYDYAITYLESLSNDIKQKIPENYRFCFEYFINLQPNKIKYDKLPKNRLVLTHIIVNENDGKTKKTIINDENELKQWSELLNVDTPQILFSGYLSDDQKDKLLEYVTSTKKENLEQFKTINFTTFILSIINPDLKHRLLNNDINSDSESIIFMFNNENNDKYYAKLVDPGMDFLISKNQKNIENNDIISLIYANILEFMENERSIWENFKFKSHDFDDRYLELFSELFNIFYSKYFSKFNDIYDEFPTFTKKLEFSMNILFIENPITKKIINKSFINKEIFKLFLILFRKKKKNSEEFLSQSLLKCQNQLVDEIFDKITKLSENLSYEQFISMMNENENDENNYIETKIDSFINEKENTSLNAMELVAFWRKILTNDKEKIEKPNVEINLIIGKLAPFSIFQYNEFKKIYEKNKLPFVIIQLYNDNKEQKFSKFLLWNTLKQLQEENPEIIKNILQIPILCLTKILRYCQENKYNIKNILCSKIINDDLQNQIGYINFENKFYMNTSLKIFELDSTLNDDNILYNKFISSLMANNYIEYKNYLPKELWIFYEKFKEEINIKSKIDI